MCFAAKKIKGFVPGGDNKSVLCVVGRGLGSTEEQDPGEADSLGFLAGCHIPAAGSVLWLPKDSQGLLSVPSGILWTVRRHLGTHNRFFQAASPFRGPKRNESGARRREARGARGTSAGAGSDSEVLAAAGPS